LQAISALPLRTRNTRGNEVNNTYISGNFVNNCLTVVSFNKSLPI
jgi:hypothetical protein